MAKSFTFRISAEGVAELERGLKSLGAEGEAAFEKIKKSMPGLAEAMQRADDGAKSARERLAQLADTQRDGAAAQSEYAAATDKATGAVAELSQAGQDLSSVLGTLGITLSLGGIVAFSQHLSTGAIALRDTSTKLGLSVEAFQAWRVGALNATVSADAFKAALESLGTKIEAAGKGDAGALGALNKLGVGILGAGDAMRSREAIIRDFAEGLKQIPDAAKRSAMALEMLGREGLPALDVFSRGAAGLDDMARSAREAGLVLDRDLIERFAQADAKFQIFKLHFEDFFTRVLDQVTTSPALSGLAAGGATALMASRFPLLMANPAVLGTLAVGAGAAAYGYVQAANDPMSAELRAVQNLSGELAAAKKLLDDITTEPAPGEGTFWTWLDRFFGQNTNLPEKLRGQIETLTKARDEAAAKLLAQPAGYVPNELGVATNPMPADVKKLFDDLNADIAQNTALLADNEIEGRKLAFIRQELAKIPDNATQQYKEQLHSLILLAAGERERLDLMKQARAEIDKLAGAAVQFITKQREALESIDVHVAGLFREADAIRAGGTESGVTREILRAEIELRRVGIEVLGEEGQARLEAVRFAAQAREEAKKFDEDRKKAAAENERIANHATERVVDFAADAFDRMFSRQKGGWRDLADFAVTAMRKAFAQMAAEALIRPIVAPIVGLAVGALGLGGSPAAAGAGGAAGGISPFNLLSGASSVNSLSGGGNLFSGLGNLLGLGAAPAVTAGGSFAAGLGPAFLGGEASLGAGAAGGLGALAGALPYIGIAALAASLLFGSGLFGGRPSVGPNGGAIVSLNSQSSRLVGTTSDNGFNPAEMARAATGFGRDFQSALKSLNLTVDRELQIGINQIGDHVEAYVHGGFGIPGGSSTARFQAGNFEDAAAQATRIALTSGSVLGLSANEQSAARKSQGTTAQEILADIAFAKSIDDIAKSSSAAEQAVKALKDQFDAATDRANALGIATAGIETERARQQALLKTAFVDQVHDQVLALTDQAALARVQEQRIYDQQLKDAVTFGAADAEVERRHQLVLKAIDDQANSGAVAAAQAAANQELQARQQIQGQLDSFILGGGSPFDVFEKFGYANSRYDQVKALADAGDAAARAQFIGVGEQAVSQYQKVFGNTPRTQEFAREFVDRAKLYGLGKDPQVEETNNLLSRGFTAQIDAMNKQIALLQQAVSGIQEMIRSLGTPLVPLKMVG
jgi:hypothetical protein